MSNEPKSIWQKIWHEIKEIAGVAFCFFLWLGILMLLKKLMLEDYQIEFTGLSVAIISSLIIAKVVILMEFIPLGNWVRGQAAIVDIVLRTLLYTLGVLIISLLEKALESRHEDGGFSSALLHVFHHRDIYHVWVGTLVVGISLFWFNVFTVLQRHFGNHELAKIVFKTPLKEVELKRNEK